MILAEISKSLPFQTDISAINLLKTSLNGSANGTRTLSFLEKRICQKNEYKALAKSILDICKAYDVPCILHTYWKAALELGHDAIHLPLPLLRELSAESQKHLQSQDSTISQSFHVTDFHKIGTSVHSVEDAMEAEQLGATYVTAGHIFTTDCKKGLPPRGLDFLKNVCDAVTIPVYGIGGIKFDPQQWNSLKNKVPAAGVLCQE